MDKEEKPHVKKIERKKKEQTSLQPQTSGKSRTERRKKGSHATDTHHKQKESSPCRRAAERDCLKGAAQAVLESHSTHTHTHKHGACPTCLKINVDSADGQRKRAGAHEIRRHSRSEHHVGVGLGAKAPGVDGRDVSVSVVAAQSDTRGRRDAGASPVGLFQRRAQSSDPSLALQRWTKEHASERGEQWEETQGARRHGATHAQSKALGKSSPA